VRCTVRFRNCLVPELCKGVILQYCDRLPVSSSKTDRRPVEASEKVILLTISFRWSASEGEDDGCGNVLSHRSDYDRQTSEAARVRRVCEDRLTMDASAHLSDVRRDTLLR
jgi:hypothetical protein